MGSNQTESPNCKHIIGPWFILHRLRHIGGTHEPRCFNKGAAQKMMVPWCKDMKRNIYIQ